MRFFDIRPGEGFRVSVVASLLFFLIAANNLIKIVRDTVFLSHHAVSELPYLYILVALTAGTLIAAYGRYTVNLSVSRLFLATNVIIIVSVIFFWFLLTFFDPGWSHYAFYIWSAIAGAIAVAQVWTLANELFSAREGQRVFGFVAAGGTVGGAVAGFGTKWLLGLSIDINHLLWVVAFLFLAASALVLWAHRHLKNEFHQRDLVLLISSTDNVANVPGALLRGSSYLKKIALLILVSVIVSTLIDFELKVAAKEVHPSNAMLAGFFSSYYAWLSIVTFLSQTVFTGRVLSTIGVIPSLYVTPGVLLWGLVSLAISPSLLIAALTKMADASLRNSIHRGGMEIVFMAVPSEVRKLGKTFLDVVVERLGDAIAGFIILLTFYYAGAYTSYVHFICMALLLVWIIVTAFLRTGNLGNVPTELNSQGPAPADEQSVDKYSKRSVVSID